MTYATTFEDFSLEDPPSSTPSSVTKRSISVSPETQITRVSGQNSLNENAQLIDQTSAQRNSAPLTLGDDLAQQLQERTTHQLSSFDEKRQTPVVSDKQRKSEALLNELQLVKKKIEVLHEQGYISLLVEDFIPEGKNFQKIQLGSVFRDTDLRIGAGSILGISRIGKDHVKITFCTQCLNEKGEANNDSQVALRISKNTILLAKRVKDIDGGF